MKDNIKSLDKNQQLQILVNIAFEKGISRAIKVARNLNNAFILDEFHDTLVDRLYNELKSRKKIK